MKNMKKTLLAGAFSLGVAGSVLLPVQGQEVFADAVNGEYDCEITINANVHDAFNYASMTGDCGMATAHGYYNEQGFHLIGTVNGFVSNGEIIDMNGAYLKVNTIPLDSDEVVDEGSDEGNEEEDDNASNEEQDGNEDGGTEENEDVEDEVVDEGSDEGNEEEDDDASNEEQDGNEDGGTEENEDVEDEVVDEGSDEGNEDSNDQDELLDAGSDDSSDGNVLPNTATNNFNALVGGIMSMILGGGLFAINKRKSAKTK